MYFQLRAFALPVSSMASSTHCNPFISTRSPIGSAVIAVRLNPVAFSQAVMAWLRSVSAAAASFTATGNW